MGLKIFFSKNKWQAKAKKRSNEKKKLTKRNKELELSRDNYRNKYYKLKEKYEELEKARKDIETELKKK